MVHYRRLTTENPDAIYFFSVVTKNREKYFTSREDFLNLWKTLNTKCQRSKGELLAYVFLADHIHILLRQGFTPFSILIAGFKRKMNTLFYESKRSLWQPRFWEHMIRDDNDFNKHADYIHYNPVKHGYAGRTRDWKYSSFQSFVNKGVYPLNWADSESDKPEVERYEI